MLGTDSPERGLEATLRSSDVIGSRIVHSVVVGRQLESDGWICFLYREFATEVDYYSDIAALVCTYFFDDVGKYFVHIR